MRVRFTDRHGATWETLSPTEARCLNEPDVNPHDWKPGVPVRLTDIARSYGPLEFAGVVADA
jgi:hypothetical protein